MSGILQLSGKNIGLCIIEVTASIVIMLAFGSLELRRTRAGKVPLFDVRLLKDRNLSNGTLVRLITALVMAGTLFAISVYLLSVLKLSAFETGLMLMPMTVGMLLVSLIAPKIAMSIGHRCGMLIGFVIAIGGCLILRNRFTPDVGFLSLLPGMFVYGAGLGFPMSLSVDVRLSTVPPQAQNSCSGLVSTGQSLGMSMGTGIIGVVLTLGAVSGLREAINTYTPLYLSNEAFRASAEMYM
ncbi:MAG: MFS transporter [Clostridia bacterium]|nr:MFS transporter [Clostridia bacterium]MBQ6375308.1 MFS transporter [Clostridia bacterium]